jgi:ATP-binding cassette subfamily B multidrug efflux pump
MRVISRIYDPKNYFFHANQACGKGMLFLLRDKCLSNSRFMGALKFLNKYFWKYRTRFLLGIVFVTISNVFAIYPAQVVRQALDQVVNTISDSKATGGSITSEVIQNVSYNALKFALFILGLTVLKGIFMFFMRQTLIVMSRLIEYDLKNEIFAHYQQLSLSFYRRNNTGDLMNRISEDVSRVRMYLGPAVMYTINISILVILVVISMLRVSPELTLYVMIPLPVLTIAIYFVSDIMNRKSEEVQEQQSGLSTFVQESISGIRVLKSFVREKNFSETFSKLSDDYKDTSMRLAKVNALFYPLVLLLVGASTLIVVYAGGREVIAGKITPGVIAEFIIYVNMLTWPVASLGWVTSIVQRAAASQQRINEFLTIQPDIISTEDKNISHGKIEFRDVSFIYPDTGIKALKDVSFTVEAGKSLAILGRTGSGKTTVANLLVRMFDITSGSIFFDDIEIGSLELSALRNKIGYVPQDVFLFSDTVANNIAFGLNKIVTQADVEKAADEAAILDDINQFPKKFDTVLGERGITLSGGQKQRVSIARAIIRNPSILIFDDCLSAVDTQTEEQILNNLKKVMRGKTTIIISHRVSSVKHADEIIVLENGTVAERGTHSELLRVKSLYRQLYEKQMAEEEMAE